MHRYDLSTRNHVLVALAEPIERLLVARALSNAGIGVSVVASGMAAVRHIADSLLGQSGALRPDMLILDTRLSGVSIAREYSHVAPVALVGSGSDFTPGDERWKSVVSALFVRPIDVKQMVGFCELAMSVRLGTLAERMHPSHPA